MGIWLLVFENVAVRCVGTNSWEQLVPEPGDYSFFSGSEAATVGRYSYLATQFWNC